MNLSAGTMSVNRDVCVKPSPNVFFCMLSGVSNYDFNDKNNSVVTSQKSTALGREWLVRLFPAGTPNSSYGWSGVCVMYLGTEPCTAALTLTLINQSGKAAHRSIKDSGKKVFSDKMTSWGLFDFIEQSKLTDPKFGFCVSDMLMIRVEINVEEPEVSLTTLLRKRKIHVPICFFTGAGSTTTPASNIEQLEEGLSINERGRPFVRIHIMQGQGENQRVVSTATVDRTLLISQSDVFKSLLINNIPMIPIVTESHSQRRSQDNRSTTMSNSDRRSSAEQKDQDKPNLHDREELHEPERAPLEQEHNSSEELPQDCSYDSAEYSGLFEGDDYLCEQNDTKQTPQNHNCQDQVQQHQQQRTQLVPLYQDICLSGYSVETVRSFLSYLYTKELDRSATSSEGAVAQLLRMAVRYQVDSLQRRCEEALCFVVSQANIIRLLNLAGRYELPLLKCTAIKFAKKNRKEIFVKGAVEGLTSLSVLQELLVALA